MQVVILVRRAEVQTAEIPQSRAAALQQSQLPAVAVEEQATMVLPMRQTVDQVAVAVTPVVHQVVLVVLELRVEVTTAAKARADHHTARLVVAAQVL